MSKQAANNSSTTQSSSASSESSVHTPASTPSGSQNSLTVPLTQLKDVKMADQVNDKKDNEAQNHDTTPTEPGAENAGMTSNKATTPTKKKNECKVHKKKGKGGKKSAGKKSAVPESDTESDSDDDDETTESDSSDESPVEETPKKKSKKKRNKKEASKLKSTKKVTKKARRKTKKQKSESESDAETEVSESGSEASIDEPEDSSSALRALQTKVASMEQQMAESHSKKSSRSTSSTKSSKEKISATYKRVDQLWDKRIHDFKLKESTEPDDSEFAEYAFLVRRKFDWDNKYKYTVVDIKSKILRSALAEVMKDCKSVSLEAEEPTIDPNTLFLYVEELRKYCKTLKTKSKNEKKKKISKNILQQRSLLKSLVSYLDDDYAEIKKKLYPLLEAGNITFDLLWALFHPNDIAVTSCYGSWDEPRCFKVEYTNKCSSLTRGEWYCIEGKYMEYDGKSFGFGDFEVDIDKFQGPRKITSLTTYPFKYHPEQEKVKKQILDRGERFVTLEGMHYKFHKGMAFMKKKKQVLKININGRVMLDPATFRRVNPNYPISYIKPKEDEELFDLYPASDDDDEEDGCCCCDSDDDDAVGDDEGWTRKDDEDNPKYKYKWAKNDQGHTTLLAVEVDEDGNALSPEKPEGLDETEKLHQRYLSEEDLLVTSPVILGFAFGEKLWLEFTISGVHDIQYNENAFEQLVLPPNQKSIVRALVESHKHEGARAIDDVVQGKGKGLVAVLHGPPGTGKTLTAEGISELLKCPLYCVSAGELGTNPGNLEHELQKILDIAHSWGAILLLDEADVFLEQRQIHDIHRNALVSIFLRLLEYFQGILFLTTNRVETFDDAFQSRIHVALRYGELTHKAKKTVWSMFLDLVRKVDGMAVDEFAEKDLEMLARYELNGRQIKNMVRTAQALAMNEKQRLTMEHVRRVIDVAQTFDKDLKGGTGYIDAMRSYT